MIRKLQINNFKCFRSSPEFEFSKINLLTGINGRGKSTVLQAILVVSQSVARFRKLEKLRLNGRHVSLGNYEDIKNSETPRGENISFKINLTEPNLDVEFDFNENESDSLTAKIKNNKVQLLDSSTELNLVKEKVESFKESIGDEMKNVNVNLEVEQMLAGEMFFRIHYISADRLGPVKYVDKESLPGFLHVGPCGEHTLNILANDNLPLVHEKLYRGKDAKTVIQQTEEWLSYILEGAKIEIRGKEMESSVLYMLLNNKNNSYSYKPSNVGFGYSYILPLIVSGLIATEGDILIAENPEAHLHPRAQSKITEFFALVASCGVQVFIESHSEHILNGLRVSTLNPNIDIKYDELTIQYFDESFAVKKLKMDEKGKIGDWPGGFFDQQEIDLSNIFKLGQ